MRSLRRIPEKKLGGRLFHGLSETASFILNHPLNAALENKARTFWRYFSWQIHSQLRPGPSLIDFVGDTKLLVKRGVAQRRICYMPLNEFEEMSFVVHGIG
jgi:hypothetical protein